MSYSTFHYASRLPGGPLTCCWWHFNRIVYTETLIPAGYLYQIEVNKRKPVYDNTQTFIAKGKHCNNTGVGTQIVHWDGVQIE